MAQESFKTILECLELEVPPRVFVFYLPNGMRPDEVALLTRMLVAGGYRQRINDAGHRLIMLPEDIRIETLDDPALATFGLMRIPAPAAGEAGL